MNYASSIFFIFFIFSSLIVFSPQVFSDDFQKKVIDEKKLEVKFKSLNNFTETKSENGRARLSFHDAVQLALENNIQVNLAAEQTREAKARSYSALGGILPNLSGNSYQNRQTINLAALGLTNSLFPGLDSTKSGPFNSFDARVKLIQNIFDLESIFRLKASRSNAKIFELKESQTKQQTIASTAQAYLRMIQAKENIRASQASIQLSKSLLKLAQTQNQSGFATGIDLARAQSRIAEEESKIIQAETVFQEEEIRLKRLIGISFDQTIELSNPLQFRPPKKIELSQALNQAESKRVEIKIAREKLHQSILEEKSTIARQIPSIRGNGDYGLSGNSPDKNIFGTYTLGVQMNVPIFDGAKTLGEISASKSQKRQSKLMLEDLNSQIEEEIRLALQNRESAVFLVESCEKTLKLSLEELKIALKRFSAGLSGNIELVTAQNNVSLNRQRKVDALTQYYLSEINLAVALGEIESFDL